MSNAAAFDEQAGMLMEGCEFGDPQLEASMRDRLRARLAVAAGERRAARLHRVRPDRSGPAPGSLDHADFKRVDEVCGMLAEKGTELGGPWSDHLEGPVWELRIRLRDVAARITYWCDSGGTIVLLTVFRKTKQHDQRQIDLAVRAQKACERDHRGPAVETYERQV